MDDKARELTERQRNLLRVVAAFQLALNIVVGVMMYQSAKPLAHMLSYVWAFGICPINLLLNYAAWYTPIHWD